MTGHTEARDWLAAELRRHGLAPAVIRAVLGGADTYAARASASAVAAEREQHMPLAVERVNELEAALREVLGRFHKRANVGGMCSSTGWIPDAQVARWRAVLAGGPAAQEEDHRD